MRCVFPSMCGVILMSLVKTEEEFRVVWCGGGTQLLSYYTIISSFLLLAHTRHAKKTKKNCGVLKS